MLYPIFEPLNNLWVQAVFAHKKVFNLHAKIYMEAISEVDKQYRKLTKSRLHYMYMIDNFFSIKLK